MRTFSLVALAALLFSTMAMAGLQELATQMPPCALKCLVSAIEESDCSIANQTCICTDTTLNTQAEACIKLSCTIKQSLHTKNVTETTCGAPIRDRTKAVSIAGIVGGVLAVVAFILRIVARFPCCGGQFGWDDATMIFTMVLYTALWQYEILQANCLHMMVIPLSAFSWVLADSGLGRDMWTLPFHNITHILYIYMIDECLYLSILPMTKISILCFYLRVFPKKSFRIATYVVIALNVGYLISFVLISVFQCNPINGAYLRWDGEHDYQCSNINAQGWAAAVVNMVLDITVMSLPLRELYNLNLSLRKKLGLLCMFGLGVFVTLVSILRLESLIKFTTTQNVTWDYVEIGYWSTIECDVGVICACLPAIRSLLRRVFPTAFGDTTNANSKASTSRSGGTSRLEGKISTKVKGGDESHFVPLVDMDNSSQAHLAHGHS